MLVNNVSLLNPVSLRFVLEFVFLQISSLFRIFYS